MLNLHPLFVHFPVALLPVALILEIAALILNKEEVSRAGWWNQILGTIALAAAVISGLFAEGTVHFSDAAREVIGTHEQFAFLAAALFGGLLFWRISCRGKIPDKPPHLFLLLLALGVGLVLTGAWFGGELVFRFGVGVR
jgi:uncharacterized membrane protein